MRALNRGPSRVSSRLLAILVTCLTALGTTAGICKENSSYGIRYTMDALTGPDNKPFKVLMPRSVRIIGTDNEAQLKNLFDQMKRLEGSKYGTTSIAFKKGKADGMPEVFVWLDETKTDRHAELIAELVFTFTERGVPSVNFPKFKLEPVGRKDVNIATFSLALPLWQAINLNSPFIWTEMPNGARISAQVLNENLAKKDPKTVDAAWKQMDLSDEAALRILTVATEHKFSNREKRCLASTESAEAALRVLGAKCISESDKANGKKYVTALAEMIEEDPDEGVKAAVHEILRKSTQERLKELAALKDLKSDDPSVLSGAIANSTTLKSPAISTALQKLAIHKVPDVRTLAQDQLIKRGEATNLLGLLDTKDAPLDLKRELALKLVNIDGVKIPALSFIVAKGTQSQWSKVSSTIKALAGDEAIQVTSSGLNNEDPTVVALSLDAMAELEGDKVLDAVLAFKSKQAELQEKQIETLKALCAKLSTKALLRKLKSNEHKVKSCAIGVLVDQAKKGDKGLRKKLLPSLTKLATNQDAAMRALAITSLGDLNEPSSHDLIIKALEDAELTVVAAATQGLRHVADSEQRLLGLVEHPSPAVAGKALESMGYLQFESAIPLAIKTSGRSERELRLGSTRALNALSSKVKNQKAAFEFYSVRINDTDPQVRRLALIGLSLNQDDRRVQAMASLAQDLVETVQRTAIELLGKTGSPQAVEGASSGLAHSDPAMRKVAILALKALGGSEAEAILKRHVAKEEDTKLKALIGAP